MIPKPMGNLLTTLSVTATSQAGVTSSLIGPLLQDGSNSAFRKVQSCVVEIWHSCATTRL